MSDEALSVLRDIWHAREQSAADLDAELGHGRAKTCKRMKNIGFGGEAEPVDEDLRTAWRAQLEREGKLRPDAQSLAELLSERDASRS
ncbi:MAG TPA: hypothetical protein VGP26_12570 [Actinophytocola sp.]|jgi:hypothetical protein|nr:hypothetical protein [Actinophytocola sp.]